MKIAIATPYTWTTPGGVNAHVAGLAGELRARGHQVVILAPADGPVEPGVVSLGRTLGVPFNGSVARVAFGPRISSRVRVALRRAHPDIVHVHEPFAPSASMLAAIAARAPLVATFHAAIDSTLYRAAGLPLRRLWRKLDARIAVSEAARASVAAVFDGDCEVIPNGVDVSGYAGVPDVDPSTHIVLFFGRLERRKGPHVLVEALPRLFELAPEARVVIAGDGAARAELERAVPDRVRTFVSFTGPFDDDDRIALFSSAAVAVLPSLGGESFGYTLVEAMSAGRPVVATSIDGYAAIVRDGVDGRLVPPGDPSALAEALAEVLRDAEGARAMGKAARERAAAFDWPVVADSIEAVYRRALATRAR